MFGNVAPYNDWPEGELERVIRQVAEAGGIAVGRAKTAGQGGDGQVFGIAMTAFVDDKTHQILASAEVVRIGDLDLQTGGTHPWVLEVVCNPSHLQTFLQLVLATKLSAETAMVRLRDLGGQVHVTSVRRQPT